jgi:tRNA 2-thiouridine synthesizing protein E
MRSNERNIALDQQGFLKNLEDWNEDIARELAVAENIALTDAHWEIIQLLKRFYQDYQLSPSMRPLVKYIAQELDKDKAKSIYLMKLFPGSPAKIAAKIAGLPKPDNCI